MSAFKRGGLASVGEIMTMQIDNKGGSLNDNLWAEMSLMTAVVVMVLAIFVAIPLVTVTCCRRANG